VVVGLINALMLIYIGLEIWITNLFPIFIGLPLIALWVFVQLFMAGELQKNKNHKFFDIGISITFTVAVSYFYWKYGNFDLLENSTNMSNFTNQIILFMILFAQLIDGIGITIFYSYIQGKRKYEYKKDLAINHSEELAEINKNDKAERERVRKEEEKKAELRLLDEEYEEKIDSADSDYDKKKLAIEAKFSEPIKA
jgi:hypothetical protein